MQDNAPAWLKAPPDGDFPAPPVDTRAQSLPFGELTWENFERLIRRLVKREAVISECWIYGVPGQAQFGLDILAALHHAPGEYACYQCKRVKDFSGSDIKKAVNKFLDEKWASKAKRLVLCTSSALSKTDQVDEIAAQHTILAAKGILSSMYGIVQREVNFPSCSKATPTSSMTFFSGIGFAVLMAMRRQNLWAKSLMELN